MLRPLNLAGRCLTSLALTLTVLGCGQSLGTAALPSGGPTTPITPAVTISAPAALTVDVAGVTLNGSCAAGLPITIAGTGLSAPVTTDCPTGTFSNAIAFSTGIGTKVVSVTQSNAAGTTATDARQFRRGDLYQTTDTLLNLGAAAAYTYTAPATSSGVQLIDTAANAGHYLWVLFPDPWGLTAGSGTIQMNYSGAGAITTTVNLTGLNYAPVNAYPALGYGGDAFGYHNGNQPPQLPARLDTMSSLIFDVDYTIAGTYAGLADVLFDQWLIPNATYGAGAAGALEVEIIPFINTSARTGTFVRAFVVPVVLNGVGTTMSFDEYSSGTGAGNDVLFFPTVGTGLSSAHLRFDALLFLNEAAATAGLDQTWFNAGFNLGTEFGQATAQNYTFTVRRAGIEQMIVGP